MEEKLSASGEKRGPDPGGGQSSPNLGEAMNSQHLKEEELKTSGGEGGPDPGGRQVSPNLGEVMNSQHL